MLTIFNCIIGLIHALCEVLVVTPFFISEGTFNSYFITVVLLVGLGGFIHSLIDFTLAYLIAFRLSKVFHFPVFNEATLQQQFLKDG